MLPSRIRAAQDERQTLQITSKASRKDWKRLQRNMEGGSGTSAAGNRWKYDAPGGYRFVDRQVLRGKGLSLAKNRILVLVLTFLCYMSYHASRKPPSIVKSVLHGSVHSVDLLTTDAMPGAQFGAEAMGRAMGGFVFGEEQEGAAANKKPPKPDPAHRNDTGADGSQGWAPFNDVENGQALLGDLDVAFLGSYALGMFVCGHLGDRLDLRMFLTWGMLGSGMMVVLFGMGYFWQIHSMPYFLSVQIIGGLFQATGWPSVVTVMANWFGHGNRGLVMGVWNAHTSVGNILGSLIAASMLQYGWGYSFVVPGLLIIVVGILINLFLVVEPQDVGYLLQSGSAMGSLAASGSTTPHSSRHSAGTGPFGSDNKAMLERKLAIIAEHHDGLVPDQVVQSMQAHHHIRRPGHGTLFCRFCVYRCCRLSVFGFAPCLLNPGEHG